VNQLNERRFAQTVSRLLAGLIMGAIGKNHIQPRFERNIVKALPVTTKGRDHGRFLLTNPLSK
jgi:hypothetical protein